MAIFTHPHDVLYIYSKLDLMLCDYHVIPHDV